MYASRWAWPQFKANFIYVRIIRNIVNKFDSASSSIPRDLRVHTNTLFAQLMMLLV